LAIKDHIATSLMIEQDDFEYAPFNQFGGIGRAYELFREELTCIMEELNTRLAAWVATVRSTAFKRDRAQPND
jgi:type I restriction enzyme R subunit